MQSWPGSGDASPTRTSKPRERYSVTISDKRGSLAVKRRVQPASSLVSAMAAAVAAGCRLAAGKESMGGLMSPRLSGQGFGQEGGSQSPCDLGVIASAEGNDA
jgi:hypothetical protein